MRDDQARTLRMMVSEMAARNAKARDESESAPAWTIPHKVVVVCGGVRGVGASTIAANLVAEAANRGIRTVRVGPALTHRKQKQRPDFFVLDAGTSADFEGIADFLVLVTTSCREAIAGAYLSLKSFRRSDPELPAGVVVNRARSPEEGAALGERIASAASSFLHGPRVEVLGWVLEDPQVADAPGARGPVIVSSSRSPAASGIRLCARRLWARWRPRWSTAAA
jgi:MinD-like ATPase involved in chromosome partitioning or flagellar assembly